MTERKKSRPKRRRRKAGREAPSVPPETSLPPLEPRPRRGISLRAASQMVAAGLALVGIALSAWFFVLYPTEGGPGSGHAVELNIPGGLSAQALTALLVDAGLVHNPRLFQSWVESTGGARKVVPGPHLLTDDATPKELMARLERRSGGGSARVTFPEGWTRFDMARRLQDRHVVSVREFLDATTDSALLQELGIEGDSAEGFLFPATYDLALDDDPRDVVRRLKREFDRRWDVASRGRSAALTDVMTSANLNVRDVVTLASMVEKEAMADEERPLIASVFLNRMREPSFKPKRLECDPTAAYGCLVAPERAPSCASFTGKPTAAIEHDPANPYSTYTHEGLPPGPIANPGIRSLEAAMSPSTSHFFFFVARGDGHHSFSETYEAHLAATRANASRR